MSKKSPLVKALPFGKKVTRTLRTPLDVFFSKSSIGSDAAHVMPGSKIVIEKLEDKGPTGTHIVRVKRATSPRMYYTIEEKVAPLFRS